MPGNKKNSRKNPLIAGSKESLLHQGKIEAKPKSASLKRKTPAWKALRIKGGNPLPDYQGA